MTPDPDDHVLTRYLLGDLDEAGQKALEERAFADERLYERVLVIEDELLADFARGVLPADERRKVEARLLQSPSNRDRVAVLEALWKGIDHPRVSPRGIPRWAVAVAAVLVLAAGSWIVFENLQLRSRVRNADVARAELEGRLREQRDEQRPLLALALAPGLARAAGSDLPTVRITDPTATIELTLELPAQLNEPVGFASIRTPDDKQVWSGPVERSAPGPVVVRVPANVLPADDYEVRLHAAAGLPALAEYYFGTRR